jgi:hypothetical protein
MSKVDHKPSVTPHLDTLFFREQKHPEYMKNFKFNFTLHTSARRGHTYFIKI